MVDLKKMQSTETLIANVYALDLVEVLKTQRLDNFFIANYILNKDYQLTREESEISMQDIAIYQKHADFMGILRGVYRSDVIAPNFEEISNS